MQLDRQPCGVSKQSCPPGYRCFDGFNCCPEATPVCGGKCCGGDWSCVGDVCVPPGAKACGKAVCDSLSGWECLETDLCCRQSDSVCNHRCAGSLVCWGCMVLVTWPSRLDILPKAAKFCQIRPVLNCKGLWLLAGYMRIRGMSKEPCKRCSSAGVHPGGKSLSAFQSFA